VQRLSQKMLRVNGFDLKNFLKMGVDGGAAIPTTSLEKLFKKL
jgi:hypothetical protein